MYVEVEYNPDITLGILLFKNWFEIWLPYRTIRILWGDEERYWREFLADIGE